MSAVLDSIDVIKQQSARHDSVVVALSFGKDSLVVMDLCCKHFKRVEAFCMSFVTGMNIMQQKLQYSRDRWGVEVKEIEHWAAVRHRAQGFRCFESYHEGKLPNLAMTLEQQKKETGCSLSVTGTRAAESLGRRAGLRRREEGVEAGAWAGDWHPIAWWNRAEVIAYLKNNNLPMEDIDKDMQGISNDATSILWLHDNHPADYQKWLEVFPLASCVVKRRELYGI